MKKLIFALLALCLATPAYANNVTGTGWGWCKDYKDKSNQSLGYHLRRCPKFNFIGMNLDVGAPDGLGASIVGRPLRFAQLELGGTTTLVGGGVRVGASVFLPWYVSPSAHIEYGHQWAGNVNNLVAMFGSNPNVSLLDHVEYDYVNLHGGLGFGHANWFFFRIQAGYSYIWANTNGLQAYVQNSTHQSNLTLSEATGHVWTPSAKVAFQFYF